MENTILQVINKNALLISQFDENSYFDTGNGLQNTIKKLSSENELLIKTWNQRGRNDFLNAIFSQKRFVNGGFVTSNKTYNFTSCLDYKGFSLACIIESSGWLKDKNSFLQIDWKGIDSVAYLAKINVEEESKKANVQFIANDPAFNLNEDLEGLLLHAKNDNTVLIIPLIYFGNNKNVVDFLNDIIEFKISAKDLKQESISRHLINFDDLCFKDDNTQLNIDVDDAKADLPFYYYVFYKAKALIALGKKEQAFILFKNYKYEKGKKSESDKDFFQYKKYLYLIEAEIFKSEGKFYDSACNYHLAKQEEKIQDISDNNTIDNLEINARQNYRNFVERFDEVNYNDRRIITISQTDELYKSKNVILLNIDNLPKIQFPVAHPKSDCTYICHPYNQMIYLPIEGYEDELLNDRINEYCYLLQCLGATSITIKNTKGETKVENILSDQKINGGLTVPKGGASLNLDKESKQDSYDKKLFKFNRVQTFNPTKKPFIPEDLLWFKNEMSWQRISKQRLQGSILEHFESLSTAQNQLISNSEINDINGEINALCSRIKANAGKINTDTSDVISNTLVEWEIAVSFKPMEHFEEILTESKTKFIIDTEIIKSESPFEVDISSSKFSEDEEKYLAEVKFMLEDDNQIDEGERKMLERMRIRFNLTQERTEYLEQSLFPEINLSESEEEYLQEFKSFIDDGIEIGERERRMLNRMSNILGVSEERAKEIENRNI